MQLAQHSAPDGKGGSRHLYFCTYFDRNYLWKGLALYRSLLLNVSRPFTLWVLCFDEETYHVLSKLNLHGMALISAQEFEAGDEALLKAKDNRTRLEYYWTCTPSLPLFIFRHNPEVDLITYLDADLFFYSSPTPIYEELGDRSILIVGHRFSPHLEHLQVYGIYNVGCLCFRRDDYGLDCLNWWRERCLEWCYNRLEGDRMGDQKYLDDWPSRFPGVVELQHPGAGLAPWNLSRFNLREIDNQLRVNSAPLVFYHFHNFKIVNKWVYYAGLGNYQQTMGLLIMRCVYAPYIRELKGIMGWPIENGRGHPQATASSSYSGSLISKLPRLPRLLIKRDILISAGPLVV